MNKISFLNNNILAVNDILVVSPHLEILNRIYRPRKFLICL